MFNNIFKSLTKLSLGLASGLLLLSSPAQATDFNYHGTECMTANLAQGQLFAWNKDGITNNSAISLFVICPMTYNRDEITAFATPRANVQVSGYLGNLVPNGTNFQCLVRFFVAQELGVPEPNDDHLIIANVPLNGVSQDFAGQGGDIDTATSSTFNVSNSQQGSAHLLCLIPRGSTLMTYGIDFFE